MVGDVLGRRLGKKRLRIGRLRPKHTAMLMTFIAGMVVTVVTVVSLSLVSEQVRTWLLESERLQERLVEKQTQVDEGEKEISRVNNQLSNERKKLADEEVKVKEATENSAKQLAQAETLNAKVGQISAQLLASSRQLKSLQGQNAGLMKENQTLFATNKEFSKQQKELMNQGRELQANVDRLEQEINSMTSEITALKEDAQRAIAEKDIATKSFETERTRINEEMSKAQIELGEAERNLATARNDLARIRSAASLLIQDNDRARIEPLIYNIGDELARLAVRSKLSENEAQSYLVTALETASKDAIQRGAERAPETRSSVAFANFTVDGRQITPDMQFAQAVGAIAANENDQVIVVRALTNAFSSEWVRVQADVYPNPVVYREGDLVIETRIDGTRGVQGVTQQIVEFIARQLRERAVRDGMVPAMGRQPELGEISQEELQLVVGEVVQANRTVSLRIHARKEARASDPLSLDLRPR